MDAKRANDDADPAMEQPGAEPGDAPGREATSLVNTNFTPPVSAEAAGDPSFDDGTEHGSAGDEADAGASTEARP